MKFLKTKGNRFEKPASSSGSALVITLGVLTLLSVLAVAFLSTSRILRRAAQSRQFNQTARDQMNNGLYLAMRQIEDSFTCANAAENAAEKTSGHRVAPVDVWFSNEYLTTNRYSQSHYSFQSGGVMTSPSSSEYDGQDYVNLLTPQVLALVPPALTNGLPLSDRDDKPLRSGWSWLEDPVQSDTPHPSRVAFAVMDLSGFIDANYYENGPSYLHQARACFNQSDVTNWMTFSEVKERGIDAMELPDTECPFSSLSYDPNPNIVPLLFPSNMVNPRLGTFAFGAAYLSKFNLNSVTNVESWRNKVVEYESDSTESPWYNDADFKVKWLDPVTTYISYMAKTDPSDAWRRMPDDIAIPYSIANAMDADRIPQISTFTTESSGETTAQALATRVNYAVEDVPLINKVTVFNIFDEHGGKSHDLPADVDFGFYDIASSLSNHYAVAVEYWYPFAPNSPFKDNNGALLNFASYVGIYTNANDINTTTNRAWTAGLLRDWFRWNYSSTSNTILQTLFTAWGKAYVAATGPSIWMHPLWQTVTYDSDLWFTTSMTNHPYWPVADTNGMYDITETPIWQSFYPATTNLVETNFVTEITTNLPPVTNLVQVVSTNVYTLLTTTNRVVNWSPAEGSTNQFVALFGANSTHAYPWTIWMRDDGSFVTNDITGYASGGSNVVFSSTNELDEFFFDGANLWATIIETDTNGVATVTTNTVETFAMQDEASSNAWEIATTNLVLATNVERVKPLPMPDELGLVLDGLMYSLPTNSVSDLYTYLMATPDDDFNWDDLLHTLSSIPNMLNKFFPSLQEPTLGDLSEENRYYLRDGTDSGNEKNGKVIYENQYCQPNKDFQGYFWTVYPKQTVNFMEVELTQPIQGQEGEVTQAVTNYYPLGAMRNGKRNTLWVRPVTTINPGKAYETDQIVDEALLEGAKVGGWTAVTNIYAPDPRRNALATQWRAFPENLKWEDENIRSTNITSVAELPFIQPDRLFASIGELGNIYASFIETKKTVEQGNVRRFESIDFASRSGAALLDLFTLSEFTTAERGLVQANTPYSSVLQTLFNDAHAGWTNVKEDANGYGYISFNKNKDLCERWANAYLEALTNGSEHTGWRCFADMMPALITNRAENAETRWERQELHPQHDYNEDVAAEFADKVSFRQNVFMIIVAAQTLAPGSTQERPVVLSDRRAAVTVLRDAFTGRWAIASWRWLP